ncbi:hypothetical protein T265_10233 [Opisthorchis viverrini]|uniref:Hexosyltransferase n=2 Tax=Opisthorchis viverrini TaxID=6198 RepID=A0A074Z786_OPIVI|nr:hypothetical protein T265_10233 [Opisthorchis viverrini]KER21442.1 hypothetical protein T265_10233 [Opisthorchis viverrini]
MTHLDRVNPLRICLFGLFFSLVLMLVAGPLSTDPHKREWLALGQLHGVRSAQTVHEEYCQTDQDEQMEDKNDHNIPDRPPFVQSDYLPTPMNINIFEQMCRISEGRKPSVNPCTNHDFPLLINAPGLCLPNQPVDLLLLISSNVTNYERRDTIRRFWANAACWLGAKVKHLFLLDTLPPTASTDQSAVEEGDIYSDIVQQKFVVTHENSTSYKLLLGFRWTLAYCPQAKWLMFVNDDQFVNPFNTVSFLLSVSEAMRQRVVVGSVWYEPFARNVDSFLYFNGNRSAPDKRYPTFVATSGMLVSSVLAARIYLTMRFTQLDTHPDLFFAHVLRKLFILPAHFSDIYAHNRIPQDAQTYERAILFPSGGKANQSEAWELLKCGKYCQ